MERQRNHRFYFRQIDNNRSVVIRAVLRFEFFIRVLPAVNAVILFYFFVRFPDGRQTGRFGSHNVYAYSLVGGNRFNAAAYKFENAVFYEPALKRRFDERERNVLRADSLFKSAFKIHRYDFGHIHVVSLIEQLFDEFGSAFAYRHSAERAVTGMRVRTQNHTAAERAHFAHILVYDGDMRRNERASVLFRGGQTENVVVFVDCAAHGAQRVVAVGKSVRYGEFFKPRRLCRLYNPDVSYIVRSNLVEFYFQFSVFARNVMRRQNSVSDGFFRGVVIGFCRSHESSARIIHAVFFKFYHKSLRSKEFS